ncbi:MAG: hypothetical protein A2Y40_07925 [Candidatus Margulisbacteria bacterium GWF2_35_9]|nr:MAG: hypothetical protein A2Y40_07925 [Candidatus Margulisbacteria bacterium GWF2_35_9]
MKKTIILLLVLFTASFCDSIGYIDSQLILKQYNRAITAQSDLAKKQKEFQDVLMLKQEELEKAKTENKTEEELLQLKEDLEQELQPQKEALFQLNQELSQKIEKDIVDATNKISKQLRIDVVLDKQVVVIGGMDLTSLVLSKLNNQ